MIEVVCFDLDDTLCDYEQSAKISRSKMIDYAVSKRHGLDKTQFQEAFNEAFQEMMTQYDGQAIFLIKSGVETRHEHFSRTLHKLGFYDSQLAHELVHVYGTERRRTLKLFPDALPVLESLKNQYRLSLVTNGPSDVQRGEIADLKIEGYLEDIIVAGEVGIAKPDPTIFSVLTTKLGIAASHIVYVGNSQEHDIRCAHDAGLQTVWINRTNDKLHPQTPSPDYQIRSLSELPAILSSVVV